MAARCGVPSRRRVKPPTSFWVWTPRTTARRHPSRQRQVGVHHKRGATSASPDHIAASATSPPRILPSRLTGTGLSPETAEATPTRKPPDAPRRASLALQGCTPLAVRGTDQRCARRKLPTKSKRKKTTARARRLNGQESRRSHRSACHQNRRHQASRQNRQSHRQIRLPPQDPPATPPGP